MGRGNMVKRSLKLPATRKLRCVLGRIHIQKWLGPEAIVKVQYIASTRDFKSWPHVSSIGNSHFVTFPSNFVTVERNSKLQTAFTSLLHVSSSWSPLQIAHLRLEKAPVTYSGGLRDDATGHHSFIMMPRKGNNQIQCVSYFSSL